MYCPKCGSPIEANSKFCIKCGSNVGTNDNTVNKSKKKKGKRVAIIIACAVTGFLILSTLSIFLISFLGNYIGNYEDSSTVEDAVNSSDNAGISTVEDSLSQINWKTDCNGFRDTYKGFQDNYKNAIDVLENYSIKEVLNSGAKHVDYDQLSKVTLSYLGKLVSVDGIRGSTEMFVYGQTEDLDGELKDEYCYNFDCKTGDSNRIFIVFPISSLDPDHQGTDDDNVTITGVVVGFVNMDDYYGESQKIPIICTRDKLVELN